jgi:hypothetical protein
MRTITIQGIVTDSVTGEPLIGATIRILRRSDGVACVVSTDLNGFFVAQNISRGDYMLTANDIGYAESRSTRIIADSVDVVLLFRLFEAPLPPGTITIECRSVSVSGGPPNPPLMLMA